MYFDTQKQKLRKNGIVLRVRRIGDRYVQTIKALRSAELFERSEWEHEIADELRRKKRRSSRAPRCPPFDDAMDAGRRDACRHCVE
jgi:inorganic triphosphatase YgiF